MAHAALNLGVGILAGTVWGWGRARQKGQAPSRALGALLLRAYGLGLWALIPSLLRCIGLSVRVTGHPLMNLFFLHPILDRWQKSDTAVAALLLTGLFALHYVILVRAVLKISPSGCAGAMR